MFKNVKASKNFEPDRFRLKTKIFSQFCWDYEASPLEGQWLVIRPFSVSNQIQRLHRCLAFL
jgi:hypothetical protein